MESMGVVARRYIDFLILLIPTPIISALFCYMLFFAASLLFVLFFNVFRSYIYIYIFYFFLFFIFIFLSLCMKCKGCTHSYELIFCTPN